MGEKLVTLLAAAGFVFLLSGCVSNTWKASWTEGRKPTPSEESRRLMEVARAKFNSATDAAKIWDAVAAHHRVLEKDPGNYEALTYLGNQYILLGTAHVTGRREKSKFFKKAMKYTELAMYTHPAFRKEVDAGKKPWEAAHTLTEDHVHAMLFWVTAVQYDFKEGMTIVGKVANVGWMKHCLSFLDRISDVAPDFGGGSVEFAKTICYFALPKSKGGDKDVGKKYMLAAVKKRDDWMFGRWARGKYYNKVMKNSDGIKEDLEWVSSRDIKEYKDPFPWRVHFQEDARRLLGHTK